MASKRKNKPALAALSVPVAVALILNTFVQPVQASFGSGRLTPCPDSVLAIGNEKISDLLAHLEDAGVGSSFSGEMQDGTEGAANEGQETADQGPVATAKNPKPSADNGRSAEDTVGRGTESDGPESNSSNGQEQTGLWGTIGEYWRQLRALRLEMPELSLTEAREAWEQILSLLKEMPDLSIGEAKKVWREIRAMRLEMSGLGFEEAKEIWEQIRDLQAEIPKLSFEEAKEIWKQISKLQVEFPDLGLAGTKEIWEQIRELQAELPDLSFEEARKAMGQIGDMRVEMPDLSFDAVQAVWLQQIRFLQSEMPDPNFGKAWELWQKIRGLQVDFPDLSFNDARAAWKHIQAMQIEFPSVDVGNAQDFLSQLRAVQIGVPEVSDDEARAIWVQIQRLSEDSSPPDFPELERVLQQIKELRLEVPSLGFDEARELWFELQELRGALPELSFEQAKDLWLELRDLKDELPAADGIFDLVVHRAERFLRGLGFEDTDGDGHLNWPEGTPFEGQDVNLEVIVTDGAGIAIAFVPVGGDIVDGVAFLIGKDPYTGECLTQLEQVLVAIAIIPLVPLSVRSARVAAKQVDNYLPLVKRGLVDFLPDSPASVRLRLVSGLVHPRFKEFRTMAGEGATTAQELADSMNISKFTSTNYRESLRRFTGISEEAASGLEAHHILPREFEEQFLRHGIETVHDPRLMVWVNPDEHRAWSSAYSSAWADFFERTPDATRLQVLEEARELSEEYGYKVLFELAE
ncbi:MAG: hypothetical protein OXF62_01925 [Caldilineaceae bacterium]|nr:hypothetical protein [Caldilineaceae bacterium]